MEDTRRPAAAGTSAETKSIPNTDEPRRPAEQPTPTPAPQPGTAAPAPTPADVEQAVEQETVPVQRSGGGADNVVPADQSGAAE